LARGPAFGPTLRLQDLDYTYWAGKPSDFTEAQMSKPEPALIFGELQEPVNWAYMALALNKTALQIDWKRNRVSGDWRYVTIYQMLIGLSWENLLKAIFILTAFLK
jgi:hypothetical protein